MFYIILIKLGEHRGRRENVYFSSREVTGSIPYVANNIFLKISQNGVRSRGKQPALNTEFALSTFDSYTYYYDYQRTIFNTLTCEKVSPCSMLSLGTIGCKI